MAPFVYTPLGEPKTEIRLFELSPGTGRLRGRLHAHELDAVKGKYYALSYCWGGQTNRATVFINDCTWSISRNLYDALRNIRQKHQGPLIMWIDALCINQDDNDEKNAQVPRMRDIYFHGRQTYVWLGLHDIWTALAFREIKMRAAWERKHGKRRQSEVGWWQWRQIRTGLEEENYAKDTDGLLTRIMAKAPLPDWRAKYSVLFRPWFSRCWVVQEIATSKVITMVCGKYHVDWNDIETAFQALSLGGFDNICTLISIRQSFHSADNNRLETLLWNTNTFQTTDPRDRVFSLFGLVTQDEGTSTSPGPTAGTRDGMRVDYDASIRDVYIETTIQCLLRTKHAGILAAGLGMRKTKIGDFPSWVLNPAPTQNDPSGKYLFAWAVAFTDPRAKPCGWTAAGSSQCEPELDREKNLLGLRGMVVDVVDLVGLEREAIPVPGRMRQIFGHAKTGAGNLKCYFQWRALAGVGAVEFYRDTKTTTQDAFLEIMCPRMPTTDKNDAAAAEKHWGHAREFDQFVVDTFPFMLGRTDDRLKKSEAARILASSIKAIGEARFEKSARVARAADHEANNSFSLSRRFVKTRKGYIGLAGTDALPGDNVVLLAGSAAPFLLRPSSEGRFKVVSDAYFVHIMDGELWDFDKCSMIWLE